MATPEHSILGAGGEGPDGFAGIPGNGVHGFVMATDDDELISDDGGCVERHFARSGVFPDDLSLSPVNAEDQSGVGTDVEQVVDDGG